MLEPAHPYVPTSIGKTLGQGVALPGIGLGLRSATGTTLPRKRPCGAQRDGRVPAGERLVGCQNVRDGDGTEADQVV